MDDAVFNQNSGKYQISGFSIFKVNPDSLVEPSMRPEKRIEGYANGKIFRKNFFRGRP